MPKFIVRETQTCCWNDGRDVAIAKAAELTALQ
jgi:hypothetical protein